MSLIFFILPQSATQILSLAGHDFLLHLLAATSPRIPGSTCRRAYRVCLRPFREVRLQRDKFICKNTHEIVTINLKFLNIVTEILDFLLSGLANKY